MANASDSGPTDPVSGRGRVSHYEIVEEIGEGGMGVVFRARDVRLPREAALKRPRPASAEDPDRHRRFLREGRATAALSHPGIVQIYEVFEEEGVPWIAMEYIRGPTLRETLKDIGPLTWDRILHITEELASALKAAHEARLLHRDIKPGNVILGEDGRARLVDFGLARHFVKPEERSSASTQSSDASKTGAIVGTTAYMSPEQALGKHLDERTDIFSLGTVLYEMCTGKAAFPGSERGQLLDAILHEEPVAIGRLNYAIPEEFERIVRKCLAKDPEERYPDTRDLLVDLRKLRRDTDTGATTGPRTGSRRRSPARSRTALGLVALASVVTVAALTWNAVVRQGDSPSSHPFYDRGIHYLEERESEAGLLEAINLLTRAVEREPGYAQAHAALATAHWERFRLTGREVFKEEAEREQGEAQRLGSGLAEVQNALGYGFLVQRKHAEAKQAFLQAVAADPNQARAWANLGTTCAELEEYDEGLQALRRAIDLRPDHFRYQIQLGRFFDRFSEHDAAMRAYQRALELKPDSWIAWSNLGAVQLRTGAYQEAITSLEKATAIEEMAEISSNLGTAYYFLGDLEKAIPHYRRAVELEPGKAVYWANLGDALRAASREDEAREAYRQAIPLAREAAGQASAGPRSHARLGMYCARGGDIECALHEAAFLEGMESPDADFLLSTAVIYCLSGRTDEALDALERAARMGIRRSRIEKDPDLARLAGDPRFRRILELAG